MSANFSCNSSMGLMMLFILLLILLLLLFVNEFSVSSIRHRCASTQMRLMPATERQNVCIDPIQSKETAQAIIKKSASYSNASVYVEEK